MKEPIVWKPAVIRVSWDILVDIPDDSTEEYCNFFLNEGTACSSRYIHQLAREEEPAAAESCCFSCHRFNGKFLRWAEAVDIKNLTPDKPEAEMS